MLVDKEIFVEILNKIDDSMDELVSQQKFKDWPEMEDYVNMQYMSRLESILQGKRSTIDELDSEMKNKLKVRKLRLFDHLKQAFQKGDI